jgi:cytoskeleton protein RodZ
MQNNDYLRVEDGGGVGERSATLGTVLRSAREQRGLSLDQVAADLRMEPHLLEALECDRFEGLAPVFAKGYLKQYGQRLGLDYGDLLARYYRQVDDREMPVVPSRPIRLRAQPRVSLWIVSALLLLLVAVALFAWWFNAPEGRPLPPAEPASVAARPEPSASARPVRPATPRAQPSEALAADSALQPPDAEATAGDDGAEETAVAASASAGNGAAEQEPDSDMLRVVITFDEDCWTEVTDARDERLFYGLARAGTQSELDAVPPVSVLLGNADGARLQVDGAPYRVPADGRRGSLARFSIPAAEQ